MKQAKLVISIVLLGWLFMLNGCSSGAGGGSASPTPPTPGVITAFSINGSTGIITGNNIVVTVPFGTNVTSLVATFTAAGSIVFVGNTPQVSGVTANDFTNPVIYTVVPISSGSKVSAKDTGATPYTVTVIVSSATAKAITSFSLSTTPGEIGTPGVITGQNIAVVMPFGTPVTALIATFTTTGTSVSVNGEPQTSGTTPNNFASPVSYIVTAGDGSTATYTVTVTVASDSSKAITAFALNGTSGVITGQSIAVTMPFGTNVTALIATFTTSGTSVSVGNVAQISGTTPNNFTSPVSYIVTAADGSTATYTVTVTVAADFHKAITAFSLDGYTGVISESGLTITVTVPFGTPITSMLATYTQTGTSVLVDDIQQTSGVAYPHNFTTPVIYVVRAADNTTAAYTVTVIIAPNTAKAITAFSINGYAGTIVESALTIAVNLPFGTSLDPLIANFITTGESVSINGVLQTSGLTPNDFKSPKSYVVTAANGTTATYIVTVTATSNVWTWMSGTDVEGEASVYGELGVPSPSNMPGGRDGAISWADSTGNLWFFGGRGPDNKLANGLWNDLWKYDISSGEWTWAGGESTLHQAGVYGTKGIESSSNIPSSREYSVSWIDGSGNLWLFGGFATDASTFSGEINDLWKYNPSNGGWTWVSGESSTNQPGIYSGPPESLMPGARQGSISWIESSGDMWLFGGFGYDSLGTEGYLNDLWKYTPGTNTWVWVGGSSLADQDGVYGNKGESAPGNAPSARSGSVSWIDSSGNLWLFGGERRIEGSEGFEFVNMNDLWRYNPVNGLWTWMAGSNTYNEPGIYGESGIPDIDNTPGARAFSISWIDSSGNMWLFGGDGYDGFGDPGVLNDLWKYTPGANTWTWISGSDTINQFGVYVLPQGTPDLDNMPGARHSSISWTDSSGNLWFFGGFGYPVFGSGGEGYLNDLWKYTP